MLLGIAFLSILTASITSAFIEARQAGRLAQQRALEAANWTALQVRLDEVLDRLERIEASQGSPARGRRVAASPSTRRRFIRSA